MSIEVGAAWDISSGSSYWRREATGDTCTTWVIERVPEYYVSDATHKDSANDNEQHCKRVMLWLP